MFQYTCQTFLHLHKEPTSDKEWRCNKTKWTTNESVFSGSNELKHLCAWTQVCMGFIHGHKLSLTK